MNVTIFVFLKSVVCHCSVCNELITSLWCTILYTIGLLLIRCYAWDNNSLTFKVTLWNVHRQESDGNILLILRKDKKEEEKENIHKKQKTESKKNNVSHLLFVLKNWALSCDSVLHNAFTLRQEKLQQKIKFIF